MKRNQNGRSGLSKYIRQRIAQLTVKGMEGKVIADRLNIHPNSVTKWRRRLGLMRKCKCGRGVRLPKEACYVCRGIRERKRPRVDQRGGT